MGFSLSTGDQSRSVFAIRPDQHYDPASGPSQADQPLLTIPTPHFFPGKHWGIERWFAVRQINFVFASVGAAFCRIV
jgi:hypothetical protein